MVIENNHRHGAQMESASIKRQYIVYILFAILSTLLNLGTQRGIQVLLGQINHPLLQKQVIIERFTVSLLVMMGTATVVGFIFKYLADKLVIFKDTTAYISTKHLRQVLLYGSFAVLTTIIFWGTELTFKAVWDHPFSEYIGGAIGLAAGYTVKFVLDRTWVFTDNRAD
jgi:putative flippase GtrA